MRYRNVADMKLNFLNNNVEDQSCFSCILASVVLLCKITESFRRTNANTVLFCNCGKYVTRLTKYSLEFHQRI